MRVTLDFPAAEEILQEVGLDEQGDTQMFHTKNVLRRIQKYTAIRRAVWKRLHRCWEMLRLLTLCKELRHHRPKASMWPGVLWTEETGAHKSYLAVKLQFRLGVMRAMAA